MRNKDIFAATSSISPKFGGLFFVYIGKSEMAKCSITDCSFNSAPVDI